MSYTHLSQHERYQIQTLHDRGFSLREIGEALDRSSSTLCRELARNAGSEGYRAPQTVFDASFKRAALRN